MTLIQEAGIGKTEEAFERNGFAVIADLLELDSSIDLVTMNGRLARRIARAPKAVRMLPHAAEPQ